MAVDKQNHALLKALMRYIGVSPSWSIFRNKAPEHIGQFAYGFLNHLLDDSEVVGHPSEVQLAAAYSFGYVVVQAIAGRLAVPPLQASAAFALPFKREYFSHQADALFNLRQAAVHAMVLSKAPEYERAVREGARALLNGGINRDEAFSLALDNLVAIFEQYVVAIPKLCVQHGVME
jgi:hypothetical protein